MKVTKKSERTQARTQACKVLRLTVRTANACYARNRAKGQRSGYQAGAVNDGTLRASGGRGSGRAPDLSLLRAPPGLNSASAMLLRVCRAHQVLMNQQVQLVIESTNCAEFPAKK